MFANLDFTMANSNGMKVQVRLQNQKGKLYYEILFPELGITEVKRTLLETGDAERFIRKMTSMELENLLYRYVDMEMHETGEVWSLHFEGKEGPIDITGPAFRDCSLGTLIEDLAELLDATLKVTRYIDPHRVDSLDVIFQYNELDPDMGKYLNGYEQTQHIECLTLDRGAEVLTYAKRYPSQCYNSLLESNCDLQIRSVLDAVGEIFANKDYLFQDNVFSGQGLPLMHFCLEYHDGTKEKVARSLSLEGLRDLEYLELLDTLSEMMLHLLFKRGMFDKRFMFSEQDRKETPFFVVYSEDDEQLIGRLRNLQEENA